MDKEKILSDNSDSGSDMEMKDRASEIPPSYPGSTSYQTPVISEPESYRATASTLMSELPPPYPGSSSAISQPKETTQHVTVTVVTSQPSRQTHSSTRIRNPYDTEFGQSMLAYSVFCCFFCCVCGSPLTLLCFVPAIMLLWKGVEYEDPRRARNTFYAALVLVIIGIISGFTPVVIVFTIQ